MQIVIPLFDAIQANNEFLIAQIVKKHSKLLEPRMLEKIDRPTDQIKIAQQAVNSLKAIFQTDNDPSISSILSNISESKLFPIPEVFEPLLASFSIGDDETQSDSEEEPPRDKNLEAWEQALDTSLSQLKAYNLYISDKSGFGTHQGVKGLQFPRVMVILDDEESRGFMFSYEKLFGAQEKTATDLKNETEGKETGIDRTRRLFYVTCSRAEESLAVVAYTQNSKAVKNHVINQGWFEENEIIDDI